MSAARRRSFFASLRWLIRIANARMLRHWGVTKLGAYEYSGSIDEREHADKLIERILFLARSPPGSFGADILPDDVVRPQGVGVATVRLCWLPLAVGVGSMGCPICRI